jgi:hypothetical protein
METMNDFAMQTNVLTHPPLHDREALHDFIDALGTRSRSSSAISSG